MRYYARDTMFEILTLNAISSRGLARLPQDKYRVSTDAAAPDAILVRSANMHDKPIPASVRAIGRAGAGVNNIPVAAMSARGVPVFNAPGANANAVKELVIAGLIIGSRHLCPAWEFARKLDGHDEALHKAVEAGKKAFVGHEISGRTVGVIGLGAIGRNVANAAHGLGMHVRGYDPALSVHRAAQLSSTVRRVDSLADLLAGADFVTVHVPLLKDTENLIGAAELAMLPAHAVVLNFAREGIVNEAAVVAALDAGKLGGFVSDFPTSATYRHPKCVTFPHLGASTEEAEENCAIMVADQVRAFLEDGNVHNSVNFPEVMLPRSSRYRIACISPQHPALAIRLPDALRDAGCTIKGMASLSRGDVSYLVADLEAAVPTATLDQLRKLDERSQVVDLTQ